MTSSQEMFEAVYAKVKEQDGILWLRILGESHWQFNELPFWVLLRDENQVKGTIKYLQQNLLPLQGIDMADVTVSLLTFNKDHECSFGIIKGERFFRDDVRDRLYVNPRCSPRKKGIFDYQYPNDAWAVKTG